MSRNSSQFNKQNELIHSLRKQLAATERELADQKWLFQQFLQSPSWRLTFPIRWLAKQVRALRDWIVGAVYDRPQTQDPDIMSGHRSPLQEEDIDEIEAPPPFDLKKFITDFYRVQFQTFLASGATLEVPCSEDPEISVLLVLYNRAELTWACLRSLAENRSERIEVIIVDNNSQDETGLMLDRLRGAHCIRNADNRGFVLGANQAARAARGEYILVLNNDTQVVPGTLASTLKTIRSSPDIGAVGARILLLDGTLQEAGSIIWRDGSCLGYGRGDSPFAPMYMFRRDVDYCSGAFLLTPRRLWQQLGGFDETFEPMYYEETDYCARLRERQLRIVYDPHSVVVHYEFASAQSAHHATELQRDHQRIFVARHHALLSTQLQPDLNSILPARMKDSGKRRVLFIDDRVPHTWLGSGFPRARAIVLALLKQDAFVTFYPLSQFDEEWNSVYADMPAEIEFMIGYGPTLLEPFLRNRPRYYDTVFISRPHNMKILTPVLEAHPEWFEETNIIYDAEAIFVTREITLQQLNGAPMPDDEVDALFREEVALASAADCVAAVSDRDAQEFHKHGVENVCTIGHSLVPAPTPRAFNDRNGFLFVGAIHEENSPNGDSVIWFLEQVFPKIQAELSPEVTFTIAGVNKSERVKQLATSSVRIMGHLPDLSGLYDAARVFVAPTRYAAGIPHKVHEAAARGLPVVATPLLASQLGWQEGDPLLVGGDADAFAQRCVELHRSRELWEKLRTSGLERIAKECSVATFEASVKDCLTRARRLENVHPGGVRGN